jgi:DNA-directed RNA polymerase specialized sigma24 family protein
LGTVKTWVHRARRELIEMLRKREIVGKVSHAVRQV